MVQSIESAADPRSARRRSYLWVIDVYTHRHCRVLRALIVMFTACDAHPPSGVFVCETNADCPPAQKCRSDGLCRYAMQRSGADAPLIAGADGAATDATVLNKPSTPEASVPQSPAAAEPQGGSAAGASGSVSAAGSAGATTPDSAGRGPPQKLGPGMACSRSSDCAQGSCVDGVCCSQSACGMCERCGRSGGCEKVINGPDLDSCPRSSCNSGANCGAPAGSSMCKTGIDCTSEICEDAVCCTKACNVCSACDVPPGVGTCMPLAGRDDPPGCSKTESCSQGVCTHVDQQYLTTMDEALGMPFGGPPMQGVPAELAQTITIKTSGQLVEIRAYADCNISDPPVSITVQSVAFTGAPSGEILARANGKSVVLHQSEDARSFENFGLQIFELRGVNVTAGMKLAWTIAAPSAPEQCLLRQAMPSTYAGGTGWMAGNGGWTVQADTDYHFVALVRP